MIMAPWNTYFQVGREEEEGAGLDGEEKLKGEGGTEEEKVIQKKEKKMEKRGEEGKSTVTGTAHKPF